MQDFLNLCLEKIQFDRSIDRIGQLCAGALPACRYLAESSIERRDRDLLIAEGNKAIS